jgi:hypothetical protein
MARLLLCFICILALIGWFDLQAQGFEGMVIYKITPLDGFAEQFEKGLPKKCTLWFGNRTLRAEFRGGNRSADFGILLTDGMCWSLDLNTNTGKKIDLQEDTILPTARYKLLPQTETGVVAGQSCRKYKFEVILPAGDTLREYYWPSPALLPVLPRLEGLTRSATFLPPLMNGIPMIFTINEKNPRFHLLFTATDVKAFSAGDLKKGYKLD